MAALQAGHQDAASFLGGLDALQKGELERALQLLAAAAGPRRDYFPAAFYLGAAFAALGRDRDAAGVWQLSMGATPRPAVVYPLAADARLRDNRPEAVVPILEPARRRFPSDPEIARRLGLAYVMTGKYAEAVPLLDEYLARNVNDQAALFAAVLALYESADGHPLPDAARARMTRYAQAYTGPQKALVSSYLEALQAPAADRPQP
jgi:tetratricopeptide (TPR) repeat protein